MMTNEHIGSSFDDFLEEEGILDECAEVAAKHVFIWKLEQVRKERKISKEQFAESANLSAAELRRLLDPDYMGVSLKTMFRAAAGLGLRIHIELVENQRQPAR